MRRFVLSFFSSRIACPTTAALTGVATLSACTVVGTEFKAPPVQLQVNLVLAGLYESWLMPLPVLIAVPLSLTGTVIALTAVGLPNNIYVQIGLVLMIALSAKNAILIVEMAHEMHQQGLGVVESAIEGARRRFRPVLMTSFAFILGVVPLLTSNGAGAAARKSIGLTVFSGMLAFTLLAVAFVPVFFVIVENWRGRQQQPQLTTSKEII